MSVSKSLFREMSGMIRVLFEGRIGNTGNDDVGEEKSETNFKLHLPSISSEVLSIVIEYMKKKKEYSICCGFHVEIKVLWIYRNFELMKLLF